MPVPVIIGLSMWAWGAIATAATATAAGGVVVGRRVLKARARRQLARDARAAFAESGAEGVELLIRERKLADDDREVELLTRAWVKELRAEARASAKAAAEAEAEVEEAPRRRPRAQAH